MLKFDRIVWGCSFACPPGEGLCNRMRL